MKLIDYSHKQHRYHHHHQHPHHHAKRHHSKRNPSFIHISKFTIPYRHLYIRIIHSILFQLISLRSTT